MKSTARRRLPSLFAAGLAVAALGCGPTVRYFEVRSHPPGATIFIEGQQRGQTDMERLQVRFYPRPWVSLRLEKDGYQTNGRVLAEDTPEEILEFYLQKSPESEGLERRLNEIQTQLEQMMILLQQINRE